MRVIKIENEIEKLSTTNGRGQSDGLRLGAFRLADLVLSPYFHMFLLLLVVAICYGRTLSSYFLADDFGEVAYISRIFNNADAHLFWSNFTGNYMQIPGMSVWRPWLLVSLAVDFLLYKANAAGYYFTNLLYFAGDVLLIYAIGWRLTSHWTQLRSSLCAFFGAALFEASPLRCESVSWVVGRVDVVCCFFYLLGFWFYLASKASRPVLNKILTVVAFWLAMGTKEMAIGLPVLITAAEFLDVGDPHNSLQQLGTKTGFVTRLRSSLVASAPLWISMAVYFALRYASLGTLGGGYVAGFGASQISVMVERWLDPDTIKRLLFPLSAGLFPHATIYSRVLPVCYLTLAGLALLRVFAKQLSARWLVFYGIWAATTAAPIFQLWGLGYNLEGSRFYFFLSVPLCLFLSMLLFRKADTKTLACASLALTVTVFTLGRVACLTDMEWVHAGRENRRVSMEAQKLAAAAPSERFAVLGIPKERYGAHLILNGATFATMLRPPFVKDPVDQRFITFEPIMFAPPEFISATRMHAALESVDTTGPLVWSGSNSKFLPVEFNRHQTPIDVVDLPVTALGRGWLPHTVGRAKYDIADGAIVVSDITAGDGISIQAPKINPLATDFLEFEYKAEAVPSNAIFKVHFYGDAVNDEQDSGVATAPMADSSGFTHARVRLSRYWRWFAAGNIARIVVEPYPCKSVTLRNFKLVAADMLTPTVTVSSSPEDGAGVIHLKSNQVVVALDSRKVPGATSFAVEVGKLNYFFDNFESSSGASPVQATLSIPRGASPKQSKQLDSALFKSAGYYELRVRCLDKDGNAAGEYSDHITLRIEPI